ncbi:MAG: hypothetical protein U5L45_08525 [Saprospiraceae bacterium]|nr:hypothetical protein [Saprospiraceae bacterium]
MWFVFRRSRKTNHIPLSRASEASASRNASTKIVKEPVFCK